MGKTKSLLILILCIFLSDCLNSENFYLKNKIPKHHLPNGSFQNNYIGSSDKFVFDLIKWKFEAETPDPITFPCIPLVPHFRRRSEMQSPSELLSHLPESL